MSEQNRFVDRLAVALEELALGRWQGGDLSGEAGLDPVEARIQRGLEALHRRLGASGASSPQEAGASREPTRDERERALVAPLVGHMVAIAAGNLRLTWDDVKEAERHSPALGEALAGLLNLNEELRFSEEQQAEARQKQLELNERLMAQNAELLREREALASLIRDLGAVMLEVSRGVLLIPLAGPYDAQRASDVMGRALDAITAREIRHVIFDFTGVPRVDEETAHLFVKLAQGASLLGANVVAAGFQPSVAKAMTSLGVELSGMTMARGVDQAIAMCLAPPRVRA